jgi:5-bromo-4-chloroindolyl phosphate hydrolysis protein
MEQLQIGIFFLVAAFGFISFLIYKIYLYTTTVQSDGKEKNYYYSRVMRNKEQVEKYIEVLQHTITIHNCGLDVLDASTGMSVQQHLTKLKSDYVEDYTEVTQKILKRNKLTRKDKKKFIKLLSDQSEKLYNIEKVLTAINHKYRG